jgi:hypothetical protein
LLPFSLLGSILWTGWLAQNVKHHLRSKKDAVAVPEVEVDED